jgi:hypothetical protein
MRPILLCLTMFSLFLCAPADAQKAAQIEEITLEQIESANVATAHDLVQRYRRAWLQSRGNQSMREAHTSGAGPSDVQLGVPQRLVYLNNARLGGVGTLRDIPAANIQSIEYYPPGPATRRWGSGHTHGVILVTTR